MDWRKLSQKNSPFARLLAQGLRWQEMTNELRHLLPHNLGNHFRVACIQEHNLVIFADNNTVAARLRMILPSVRHQLSYANEFLHIKVHLTPDNQAKIRPINRTLTPHARQILRATADKLKHHEPLSDALSHWSNVSNQSDKKGR